MRSRATPSPFEGHEAEATALAELTWVNPFGERRIELERAALGSRFVGDGRGWSRVVGRAGNENDQRLRELANTLAEDGARALRERSEDRVLTGDARRVYRDVALFAAFQRINDALYEATVSASPAAAGAAVPVAAPLEFVAFDDFARELTRLWTADGSLAPTEQELEHLVACAFQVRRAFHHVFHQLLGVSKPAARLRAAVWESVFTSDLRAYVGGLHAHVGAHPTLIVGPSGTGKELVARAVSLARFAPFDGKRRRFDGEIGGAFRALNVAALAPTIVESELFGHKRGAFTGALEDRAGWLESCAGSGVVFLDEIGELSAEIQVKLLRLLEAREYHRLGETKARRFEGKFVAATNRELGSEMAGGRFREDLYYRLCSDVLRTPSLAERVRDDAEELPLLVNALARRIAGEIHGPTLAERTLEFLKAELPDYDWPGNVRELEQCVRNVLLRGRYAPMRRPQTDSGASPTLLELANAGVSAEQLLDRYCSVVLAESGSYVAAAERLGLDRRTVARRAGNSR